MNFQFSNIPKPFFHLISSRPTFFRFQRIEIKSQILSSISFISFLLWTLFSLSNFFSYNFCCALSSIYFFFYFLLFNETGSRQCRIMKMILTENRGEFMSYIIFTLNSSPPSSTLYFIYNFRYVFFAAVGWMSHCRCSMSLKSSSLSSGVVVFPCVSSLVLARLTSSAEKRERIDFLSLIDLYDHHHHVVIIIVVILSSSTLSMASQKSDLMWRWKMEKFSHFQLKAFFTFSFLCCCHCRFCCLHENFFIPFSVSPLALTKKTDFEAARRWHKDNENFHHVLITRHFDGEEQIHKIFSIHHFLCLFLSASRHTFAVVIVYSNSLNFLPSICWMMAQQQVSLAR